MTSSVPSFARSATRALKSEQHKLEAVFRESPAAMALWRPAGWPVWAGIAVALAAFGLWGIADRSAAALDPGARSRRVLLASRALAVLLGAAGALVALWGALFLFLGTWIS